MDLLEHSVRTIEEFMGEEFPVRFAGILFKDAVHAPDGAAGTNFGNVITQLPEYDVDDDSPDANFLPGLTAHEIAHFYWVGDEDWIDEGAATFMEFIVENARTGAPLVADHYPCPFFDTLGELDRANPRNPGNGGPWPEFRCNYSMGERLFLDLYRTLGREQFRQGFRNLYLASKERSVYAGIEEVETTFKKDASPEVVAAVDSVLNRQYYGTEPYDLSFLDTSPVDPNLRSVDGYVREAFIVLDLDRPDETRTDQFSAADFQGWIYFVLRAGLPSTQSPKELMLEYVEYYEDGFAYGRRAHRHVYEPHWTNARSITSIGSSHSWRPGSYGVYVYEDDRKVAEVAYEVTP